MVKLQLFSMVLFYCILAEFSFATDTNSGKAVQYTFSSQTIDVKCAKKQGSNESNTQLQGAIDDELSIRKTDREKGKLRKLYLELAELHLCASYYSYRAVVLMIPLSDLRTDSIIIGINDLYFNLESMRMLAATAVRLGDIKVAASIIKRGMLPFILANKADFLSKEGQIMANKNFGDYVFCDSLTEIFRDAPQTPQILQLNNIFKCNIEGARS